MFKTTRVTLEQSRCAMVDGRSASSPAANIAYGCVAAATAGIGTAAIGGGIASTALISAGAGVVTYDVLSFCDERQAERELRERVIPVDVRVID